MTTVLKNIMTITLLLSTLLIAKEVPDNDEGWHSHRPIVRLQERAEEKVKSKQNTLKILDKLLSSFEDMTEHTLDKDLASMHNRKKLC